MTRFTWWLAPTLASADWERELLPHGFRYDDHTPGMAVDLATLNTNVNTPPSFTIAPVADAHAPQSWARIITISYHLPASSEEQLLEL